MYPLIPYWERDLIYKSISFFQYLIISEVNNLLIGKYIFFEIFKDLVFLEKSPHSSVGFFQFGYKKKKISSIKFYNYKSFSIRTRCIYLGTLFNVIISKFSFFSWLMNCQSGLQQQPQGLSDWHSGRAKTHTYRSRTRNLIKVKASVDYTLSKFSEYVFTDSCR